MRIFFLLLLSIASFGQINSPLGFLNYAKAVKPSSVTPTPAVFKKANVTVADGSANIFVYEPLGLNIPPVGGWPVIIFTGGDGTSNNNTRTFTAVAMSTGDNLTYTHSPTGALFRIMPSSIVIKVNGTPVAYGAQGGTITGSGVSGSITSFDTDDANTNTSPTVSVTFTSSQAGNTITYDYIDSTIIAEGIPRWVNLGDNFDNRAIFIAIQNVGNTVDFDNDYYDKCVEYAWDNYNINTKRISNAGISRGGRAILDAPGFMVTRYNHWINRSTGVLTTTDPSNEGTHATSGIASIVVGTASYGAAYTAANYTDIGQAIVHGTADGTLTNNTPSYTSTMAANNEPPYVLNVSGVFHNRDVWDGKCYKRLYRVGPATGSITTADWDYVDFLLKFSKDATETATLHVEQAEKRRYVTEKDIIDYRQAKRKVDALGAGATKDALLARLVTVKSLIDGSGTRWVINFHNTGDNEASPYNNFAAATSGTTITNMVDFNGGASTMDIQLMTTPGGGMVDIGAADRRSFTGGFTKKANESGIRLTGFPLAEFDLTGIPAGTYTVRIYHNEAVASFATNPVVYCEINSVVKTQYSAINTLIGYVEYTGITDAQLANINVARNNDNTIMTLMEIYKNP